jgi:hypothetical protein
LTDAGLLAEFRGHGSAPKNKFGSEVSARKSNATDDDRHQKIVCTHVKRPLVIPNSKNHTSEPRSAPDEVQWIADCFLMNSL